MQRNVVWGTPLRMDTRANVMVYVSEGSSVMVTRLIPGQRAIVLQLPAPLHAYERTEKSAHEASAEPITP